MYHSIKKEEIETFQRQLEKIRNRCRAIQFDDLDNPYNGKRRVLVTFDDGFRNFLENALPALQSRNIPAVLFIATGYLGKLPGWIEDGWEYSNEPLLERNQVAILPKKLVKVGSHTITHPHLDRIPACQLRRELEVSKSELERIVGASVDMLSFPFGSFNNDVIRSAKETGYRKFFTNVPVNGFWMREKELFGRLSVSPSDWPIEFFLKISGGYDWLANAILLKRRIVGIFNNKL